MTEKKKEEKKEEPITTEKEVVKRLRAVDDVLKLVFDQVRQKRNAAVREGTGHDLHRILERIKISRADLQLARAEYENLKQ